jgi:hypothetical protein
MAISLVFVILCMNSYICVFEDAFISYRYAQKLVDGYGLVFNPQQHVWGYSNLLWTLLLAACLAVGVPIMLGSRLLAVLCSLLIIFLLLRWPRRYPRCSPLLQSFGAILFATSTSVMIASQNGMETMLFTALGFSGALLLVSAIEHKRSFPGYVVPLLLAAMTRPEGPLLAVTAWFVEMALFLVDRDRSALRRLLTGISIFVTVYLAYLLIMYSYYGSVLPNSYYTKINHDLTKTAPKGLAYIWTFFVNSFAYIIYLPILFAFFTKCFRKSIVIISIFIASYLTFIVVVGGDFTLYCHRFIIPSIPFLIVLNIHGLYVVEKALRTSSQVAAGVVCTLLVIAIIACNLLFVPSPHEKVLAEMCGDPPDPGWLSLRSEDLIALGKHPSGYLQRISGWFSETNANIHGGAVGSFLDQIIGPDAIVATCQCGQIPFYLPENEVVDLCGLMDNTISRDRISRKYLTSRNIDYFVLFYSENHGDYYLPQTIFPSMVHSRWFLEDFELVHTFRYSNILRSRNLVADVYYLVFARRLNQDSAPAAAVPDQGLRLDIHDCIESGRYTELVNRLDWIDRGLSVNQERDGEVLLARLSQPDEPGRATLEADQGTGGSRHYTLQSPAPGKSYDFWVYVMEDQSIDRSTVWLSAEVRLGDHRELMEIDGMKLSDMRRPGRLWSPMKISVPLCRERDTPSAITVTLHSSAASAAVRIADVLVFQRDCVPEPR